MKKSFLLKTGKLFTLLLVLLIQSCSTDDDITKEEEREPSRKIKSNIMKTRALKSTIKELGYNSYQDLKNNTKLLGSTDQDQLLGSVEDDIRNKMIKDYSNDYLKVEDAEKYGYTEEDGFYVKKIGEDLIRDLGYKNEELRHLYGYFEMPARGVQINDFKTKYATWNLADKYKWYAYQKISPPTCVKSREDLTDGNTEVTTFEVRNESYSEDKAVFNYSYVLARKTSHTTSFNVSIKLGLKFKVPLISEGSVEISAGMGKTSGEDNEERKTLSLRYTSDLPPRSKRTIIIIHKKVISKTDYTYYLTLSGVVGVNYYSKVQDHYFWARPASILLTNKFNRDDIIYKGTVKVEKNVIEAVGGPIEKL